MRVASPTGLESAPMLVALGGVPEIMVAGAGFGADARLG